MKKLLALILALGLVACLAACAGDTNKDETENPGVVDETPNETPDAETPDTETPDEETPDAETPDEQTPEEQTPDAETPDAETPDEGGEAAESELSELFVQINDGIEDLPGVWDVPLDAETFEVYAFAPWQDGYEALCSEAMINAVAHSAVLVKVPEGTDAQALADEMQENANPNKWICVGAESVQTAVNGNYVLLVMSSQAVADAMIANFEALSL